MNKNLKVRVRIVLFILLLLSYCITSSDTAVRSQNSLLKYGMLLICLFESVLRYYRTPKNKKKDNKPFSSSFKGLFIVFFVFLFFSLAKSVMTLRFSFRTVKEFLFLVCPMLYGFFVINTWEKKDIDKAMKYGLFISFIFYIFSLNMGIREVYQALIASSFRNSHSLLESFTYCGLALSFFFYFCYYDKKRFFKIVSFLFVIMTFKRVFVLLAILLLILSKFKSINNPVSKKTIIVTTIIMSFLSIVYYQLMQPQTVSKIESRYNISVSKLTTTRSDRMRWLVNSSYESYGFGTSTEYMYNNFNSALEMDLCKIIIELGIIPLIVFIYNYLNFSSKTYYTYFFMLFMIINLILSSGLTGTITWCLIFITIAIISKEKLIKKGEVT